MAPVLVPPPPPLPPSPPRLSSLPPSPPLLCFLFPSLPFTHPPLVLPSLSVPLLQVLLALATVLSMLVALGVHNFSIVTYAHQAVLIKAADQAWDSAAKHRLLAACAAAQTRPTEDSQDALGLAAAVATLVHSPKVRLADRRDVLMFTDGKGLSSSRALQQELAHAAANSVTCTAVGVGPGARLVSVRFPGWVWCGLGFALPRALQGWHSPPPAPGLPLSEPLLPTSALALPVVDWKVAGGNVLSFEMGSRVAEGAESPGAIGVGPALLGPTHRSDASLADLLAKMRFSCEGYRVCPICRQYTSDTARHHTSDHAGVPGLEEAAYTDLTVETILEHVESFFGRRELEPYDVSVYGPLHVYTLETSVYKVCCGAALPTAPPPLQMLPPPRHCPSQHPHCPSPHAHCYPPPPTAPPPPPTAPYAPPPPQRLPLPPTVLHCHGSTASPAPFVKWAAACSRGCGPWMASPTCVYGVLSTPSRVKGQVVFEQGHWTVHPVGLGRERTAGGSSNCSLGRTTELTKQVEQPQHTSRTR